MILLCFASISSFLLPLTGMIYYEGNLELNVVLKHVKSNQSQQHSITHVVHTWNKLVLLCLPGPVVRWDSPHIFHGDWEANGCRANGEGKQGKAPLIWILTCYYFVLFGSTGQVSASVDIFALLFFLYPQSPKSFLESYEDMLLYTQREESWPVSKMELDGRGVSIWVLMHYTLTALSLSF